MKIVLDTEVCKKEGKDVDLALYLISLLCGSKITQNTFEKARQQRLLTFSQMYDVRNPFPDYVTLTDTGEHIVESLMASSVNVASEERCTQLAEKLREIFPAGKKPGYAYTWRDSVSCITDNIIVIIVTLTLYPNQHLYSFQEYLQSKQQAGFVFLLHLLFCLSLPPHQ